jgi:Domain of unknown function (DUF6532)
LSIPSHYSLSRKLTGIDDINILLEDNTYLYLVNSKVFVQFLILNNSITDKQSLNQTNRIDNSCSYCHPTLLSIMKTKLFSSPNSIGYHHYVQFTSSIIEGPRALELELSASMVVLVAIAVSLSD